MAARSREERLFGAACVRVTLESAGGGLAGLYADMLKDLELDASDVEAYLEAHREEVEVALARRGKRHGS
ncbi:MAG: hypothetical protein ACFB9M_05920 [Myxococcota bacterium]